MEGKAVLFKQVADIDVFPICLDKTGTEKIFRTVKAIAPGLGCINLKDVSSPRCIEIEDRLKAELDIPVFRYVQAKCVASGRREEDGHLSDRVRPR